MEGTTASDPRLQVIIQQFETILVFLERPVVQQQLIALAVVILFAWLLSEALHIAAERIVFPRMHTYLSKAGQEHRWLAAVRQLYFPIWGLVLVYLGAGIFSSQGQPNGLLTSSASLLWVLLVYRVLAALLYVIFSESTAGRYHRRILTPLLVWLTVSYLIDGIIDINLLAGTEVGRLFDTPITLGTLVATGLVFYIFLVVGWILQDVLQNVIMPRTAADPGVTHSVMTISRYFVIAVGILVAAGTLGFDLTTLALIGGGLSIGIGFGLQQIVANFISGILLLFEQTLRPGDVIEINGAMGTVQKLNIRSTLVLTNDDIEIIVPNETFLTSQVITYTKSNRLVRLSLSVGVSYHSDPKQVRTILLETAAKHGLVQDDPPPTVFFNDYGESSLNFRLAVWIDQPERIGRVRSDLYFMIWEAFARHNIEIPFPQRDLNLRQGWEKVMPHSAVKQDEERPDGSRGSNG